MIGLQSTTDWAEFTRQERLLDVDVPYSSVREPWQEHIDVGISTCPRAYLQLPRGHDKTERYAWWSMLWLETSRACRGYAAGVDRDNAKLFRDAAKKIKALHPEVFDRVEIEKHVIFSKETGSYVETISSDVQSAYGLNFDLLIVNDFHAWKNYEFWEVLWTACEKRPDIRVWVESNALTLGSEGAQWVAKFRRWVKEKGTKGVTTMGGPEWFFFCPDRFLATWQARKLEQFRQTLLPSTYKRLIDNQDSSGAESFLSPEQVKACEVLNGPADKRVADRGRVVTAIDAGLKKDVAAVATVQLIPQEKVRREQADGTVVIVKPQPRLVLLALDVMVGNKADPVLLEELEKLALDHRTRFGSWPIVADPWQMVSFIQRHQGVVEEWPFTGASISQLTQVLYRCIADQCLALYDHAGEAIHGDGERWDLQRELTEAVVKDMSYGQRVDHKSGGCSDRLVAVGMACHRLLDGVPPKGERTKEIKQVDDKGRPDPAKIVDKWMAEYEKSGRRWRQGSFKPIVFGG